MGVDGGSSRSASVSQSPPPPTTPPSPGRRRPAPSVTPSSGPPLEDLWKNNYSVYGRRKLTKAARRAGHRRRAGPGGPPHARPGHPGRQPGEEALHHQVGPRCASAHRTSSTATSPPSRPDALWVADFTYCSTWSGIVYVAFIIDVFSRRLVGWKAARTMTTPLVLDALNMAAWTRRHSDLDELICHTDAGSQYTSIAYTERLDDIGAAPSIGTIGDSVTTTPWPNRSWASSRPSCTATPPPWRTTADHGKGLDDLEIATCAWVSWFNEERLHSELGDRTPAEVEADYSLKISARRGMRKPNERASVKPRPIQTVKWRSGSRLRRSTRPWAVTRRPLAYAAKWRSCEQC